MSSSPIQSNAVMADFAPEATSAAQPVYTPICPTSPQVPIPEDTAAPFIWSLKIQVDTGPITAEERMAGSQIFGFFTIFPI